MVLHKPHGGSRFLLCLATSISLLLFSSLLAAQDKEPVEVISVRTDLVAIPVTVTDSRGRRISDLKQQDFVLTDDGRNARIDYFASGAERIALAFVLDNSGSLREQTARQRDAALGLFSRFGAASSVAVVRFGQTAKLVAPFNSDADSARAAFSDPLNLGEHTAIFDAGMFAIQAYAARGEHSPERRIAILISDGLDTASSANARQVIAAANRTNVSFYVIQLPLFTPSDGHLAARPATKGFRDLADKTGGKYFVAGTSASALNPNAKVDLTPVLAAIEEDLRSQYVIGFYPGEASRDDKPHRLSVDLVRRSKNVRVRMIRSEYSLRP